MTNDKTIFTFGRASSHDISEGISHKRRMPFCFSANRIKVTTSQYLNNSMFEKKLCIRFILTKVMQSVQK